MKKFKFLVSVVAMSFVMVGCGESSDSRTSIPIVDNSVLADAENQYGYFGEDVIFVNAKIVGTWNLFQESSDAGAFVGFSSDGDITYQQMGSITTYYGDYGVSKDGKVITAMHEVPVTSDIFTSFPVEVEIRYQSLLEDMMTITNFDGTQEIRDCYSVELTEDRISGRKTYNDIIMCP